MAARDRRGDTVYIDLAEWGAAGRAAAQYLHKGSMIAFAGELRFRETNRDGGARQFLSAVGHIEFLDGRGATEKSRRHETEEPVGQPELDDIPF